MMHKTGIHSVPRSGSSWLGTIFDSSPNVAFRFQPLFSYSHKGQLDSQSASNEVEAFFNDIYHTTDPFVLKETTVSNETIPDFPKDQITHLVYKEVRYHNIIENLMEKDADVKIIGLIRNPLATLYSWFNAPKEFRSDLDWTLEEEWQFARKKNQGRPEEYNGYEKWKEFAQLMHRLKEKHPDRLMITRYIDLLGDPISEVMRLFEFSGIEFTKQTADFIELTRSKNSGDAYGIYNQRVTDNEWRSALPKEIIDHVTKDLEHSDLWQYF